MSTRSKILATISLVMGGAIVWYWAELRQLLAPVIAYIQAHSLYVLAISNVFIVALVFLFSRSAANARFRKRELDEYLRVAQQTQSSAPQALKKGMDDARPKNHEGSVKRAEDPSQQSLLTNAPARAKSRKRKITEPKFTKISGDLYFQPVTNLSDGKIIGYEVYRQAIQATHKKPVFIQFLAGADKTEQAKFEYATLEKAASAANHDVWNEISQTGEIRLFVPVSEALLDDIALWQQATTVLGKQRNSGLSIALSIRSTAFASATKTTINGRIQKLVRLHSWNLPLAIHGFFHDPALITDNQLQSFYLFCCEKSELLSCYAGEAEPDTDLAYQQIQKLGLDTSVRGIVSESDVVDCMAAGAKFMSGDFLAPPRKLKTSPSTSPEAGIENTYG